VTLDWANVIGLFGSVLFIVAFAYANQAKQLNKLLFNAVNLLGAVLLLTSLYVHFNLAAFVLEVAWAVIALLGIIQAVRARQRAMP
jgi:multisubunit Na+/H+ antiporter MnhC subunit